MANPLAMFRKYEKVLLVIFGVALMLVFTVGGIVSQYMYREKITSQNEVVVNLKSEKLRESDIQNLQFARYHLRNFMRMVNQAAAEQGATPQQGLGIPDTDAEADLVQTAILARQAEKLGIQVSDQAIVNFLTHYSQNKLGLGDFARILQSVSQGRMSQTQFFDAMRRELLAQRFITVFERGILPPTPEGSWDYFQRLNRRLSFEAVPFEVADYLARVEEPTDEQITAVYEEGKNRYPLPDSPEPGFKQLKQVALQYVKGDLSTFLAQEKALITDDQVKQYYEANRERFRNTTLPAPESPALPGGDAVTPPAPGSEAGATPPTPGTTPTSDAAPTELPTADGAESTRVPEDVPNEPQATQDDPGGSTGPEANSTPPAEISETATTPPNTPGSSENSDAPEDTPEGATDNPAGVQAVESDAAPATTDEISQAGDAATDQAPPADPLSELPTDAQSTDPLADLPEAAGNNTPAKPEFKPLEEVADEIRTLLATPPAQQKLDQGLNTVRSQMRTYFGNYLAWDVSPERDTTPQPSPPDLQALATEHQLTYGSIPMVNVFQLQQTDPVTGEPLYEISRAYDTNYVPFAQNVYSDDLRLYEVRSIRGQVLDTEYLYWKTQEAAERVPELSEVRDQVVRSLKMKRALELAKHDAQQMADKLNQSHQRPRDLLGNDPNRKVIDVDSVTWMTSMSVPYLPPQLSRIAGIEYPGDQFMRQVFSLAPGEAGTAVDNPQDTVYVVGVTHVDSDDQQLRDQFLRAGMTPEIAMLARRDSQRQLQNWYAALEKELGVQWEREPRPESRSR
jgi:hypothetical protein